MWLSGAGYAERVLLFITASIRACESNGSETGDERITHLYDAI